MGRLATGLGIAVILAIFVFAGIFTAPKFTGFLIYSQWTNGTVAEGEGSILNFRATSGNVGDYLETISYNGAYEILKENTTFRIVWNYDFNTTYNKTQPALLIINISGIKHTAEYVNIIIYNFNTSAWDFVNQTTQINAFENIITILSWSSRTLSNYVNQSNGKVMVGFEDVNTTSGQRYLYIDYLAINATFSPLFNNQTSISNASGVTYFSQQNYTRYNYTRADVLWVGAEWNASNVTNGTVIINASGNVSSWYLSNITANWTYANLTLSNVTMFPTGGNVTVSFTANDSYYQTNGSHITMYFGLFSNASVTAIAVNETGNVVSGTPVKVYCRVADTYSNIAVAGYNVSFYNNSNLFNHAVTNSTGWASSIYNGTAAGGISYYLNCTIGNSTGQWYYNSSAWNKTTLMNVVTDTTPPNIDVFWMDSAGVNSSYRTNLYANISINLNATDIGTSVQSGTFNLSSPSGVTYTGSMQIVNRNLTYIFANNETGLALNETGNYTVNVTVTDLGGNQNISWNLTFNVTNNYTIALDGYSSGIIYNRGENLTFAVLDTNGVQVAGANITANLTYPTNTVSSWFNSANNTLTLALNSTLNVTNYTMKIIAVKGNSTQQSTQANNTAYGEFRFNVTDVLKVLLSPYSPTPNTQLGSNLKVYINNTRGGRFPYTATVNVTCSDGTYYMLAKSGETYSNSSVTCTAPNSYSTSYSITVNATDSANNDTNTTLVYLTTSSAPSGPGGGDGGGGGGGTVTKNCTCEWTSTDICGTGGCQTTEVLQRWVCNPAGCKLPDNINATTRCIYSPVFCELNRRGFDFTLSRDYVEVKRGENATIMGSIINTGNLTLDINLTVEGGCCTAFTQQGIVVQNLSSVDVPITVHPALAEALGDYLFTVNARSEGLEASKGFTARVLDNPLLADIGRYRSLLDQLKDELVTYANNGLDISSITPLVEEIQGIIYSANESAAGDNLAALQEQLAQAKAKLDDAVAKASSLGVVNFILENKWWIALSIVLAFIALYLLTQIAVPFIRLTREIRRMVDKEQSQVEGRKATYKDYFMGKVDEKAFEEMIIGKQSEILSTKGALRHKMDERNALVRSRLSPKAVKEWLVSGFGLRNIAARLAKKIRKRKGEA